VELFAWRTQPGYALHVLNYTNPNMFRGWFRDTYPIADQHVRMHIAEAKAVKEVRALRSGKVIQHQVQGDSIEFVIPEVRDYEIAAITLR
jgi:hypothetical protein